MKIIALLVLASFGMGAWAAQNPMSCEFLHSADPPPTSSDPDCLGNIAVSCEIEDGQKKEFITGGEAYVTRSTIQLYISDDNGPRKDDGKVVPLRNRPITLEALRLIAQMSTEDVGKESLPAEITKYVDGYVNQGLNVYFLPGTFLIAADYLKTELPAKCAAQR